MRWFQVSATKTSPSGPTATPHGSLSWPSPGALDAAERALEGAVAVEDLDAVVLGVRDVEVPAGVGGDAARLGELAGPGPRTAEDAGRRQLHAVGGVVARGGVLDREVQRLEDAAAAEVLADEESRVLRADGAPDLVEEPPPEEVLERRPRLPGLRPSAPGTTRPGSGRAWRRTWRTSCFSSAPSGSQSAMMTGVEAWSMRVAQAVGTSRRYQVRGHALSPATVITCWPGGDARLRPFDDLERAHEVPRRLDVGEHLGVARLLRDVVRAVAEDGEVRSPDVDREERRHDGERDAARRPSARRPRAGRRPWPPRIVSGSSGWTVSQGTFSRAQA